MRAGSSRQYLAAGHEEKGFEHRWEQQPAEQRCCLWGNVLFAKKTVQVKPASLPICVFAAFLLLKNSYPRVEACSGVSECNGSRAPDGGEGASPVP